MIGACTKCGTHGYIMPLHGERGGPLYCFMCAGVWHAKHAPRRRAARVVIKALKAYEAAGGSLYGQEFDELKLAAGPFASLIGRASDAAGSDFADLTSELLDATIELTHPDKHPVERRAEANRVTQELLALKPFVFPAPEPEPPPKPNDGSLKQSPECFNKPSQPAYPCDDCRYAVPRDYCDPCRATWEKKQQEEEKHEEEQRRIKNGNQRYYYKRKKEWASRGAKPVLCESCGEEFKPKRSDAKYCCAACRQRAYVKRDGKESNARPLEHAEIERTISEIFTANPDSAFTTDELCDYVFPEWSERKQRAAVVAAAKTVSDRLGEHRTWTWQEHRGGRMVFFNHASVTSYAMARLKAFHVGFSEEELKAKISPGGDHHYEYVAEGGVWWRHCQEHIAKFKNRQAEAAE